LKALFALTETHEAYSMWPKVSNQHGVKLKHRKFEAQVDYKNHHFLHKNERIVPRMVRTL